MDVDQLVAFERIAREGSFSRAAWALGLAQPTVSARMRALEAELGGALFVRRGRGVALSDLGASFLPYARRALELLREGAEAARQAQAGHGGRVTIGVLESLSGDFLGPALAEFHAAHPRAEVLVRAGRQEVLLGLLRDGVIGLCLICWPCAEALDAPMEPICALRERVVVAVAPSHPLARLGPVDTATLLAQARPFMLLRWWPTLPQPVAELARRAAAVVDVPMNTARHLALGGVGVGLFTWMQVADALAAGDLVEVPVVDLPALERASALVRLRRAAPLTPAALALAETLRARAARLGILDPSPALRLELT